jgi:hypothetical protein
MPDMVTTDQYQNVPRDIDPKDPQVQRKLIDLANQLNSQVTSLRNRVAELEAKVSN